MLNSLTYFLMGAVFVTVINWILNVYYRRYKDPDQARYNREMHYLESIVHSTAHKEGRVSKERMFEKIPEMKKCRACRTHLSLVFEYGVLKKELIEVGSTKTFTISEHVRNMVEDADHLLAEGWPGPVPESKLLYTHNALHPPAV